MYIPYLFWLLVIGCYTSGISIRERPLARYIFHATRLPHLGKCQGFVLSFAVSIYIYMLFAINISFVCVSVPDKPRDDGSCSFSASNVPAVGAPDLMPLRAVPPDPALKPGSAKTKKPTNRTVLQPAIDTVTVQQTSDKPAGPTTVCRLCGKRLKNASGLHTHLVQAHEPVARVHPYYYCDECGQTYRYRRSFLEHKLKHSGGRQTDE